MEECWSRYKFPVQYLPPKDLELWRRAILQIQQALWAPLGRFLLDGHKLWEWRLDEAHNRLQRLHLDGMDVYTPSFAPQYANHPSCWTRLRVDQQQMVMGNICLVNLVVPTVWKVCSSTKPARPPPLPRTLKEMFSTWGCAWLWEDLRWRGDPDWLAESI
jgi:hypothetical protein